MKQPEKRWKQGILIGILVLGMVMVLALGGCSLFRHPDNEKKSVSELGRTAAPVAVPAGLEKIVFEEPYPPELPRPAGVPGGTYNVELQGLPRVAIIIDDMGYHREVGKKLLALDLNLTFSFLPNAPHTPELEQEAYERGRDILLHQPLEAADPSWDIGPGGLYLSTPLEDVAPIVERNLDRVPYAIGINNHMGSKYTVDRPHMQALLAVVKKRDLFFVDSFTTAASVGFLEAARMGIDTARRHLFLDNIHNHGKICEKLDKLITRAQEYGFAIAIGHPNQETLTALTACRENLLRNARIVGVHELVGRLQISDMIPMVESEHTESK